MGDETLGVKDRTSGKESCPDCSIIVVNYNSGRWLQDCLRSVQQKSKGTSFEVLVVDNGSTDGSLSLLNRNFPNAKVIKNEKNEGLAKALNQGIRASRGRYVLWLNPDVIFLSEALEDWLKFMDEHAEIGISGPKVYDDETRQSVQLSCRSFPSYLNYLFSRYSPLTQIFPDNRFSRNFLLSDFDHNQTRSVDWVSGCCMLLRREMLEQIGLLDEGYPLFFEDVDICYRAHQAGWQVVYHPVLEVAHYVGSVRAQAPLRTTFERHQSLWRFYRKFHARSYVTSALVGLGIYLRMAFLITLVFLKNSAKFLLDAFLIQVGVALAYLVRGVWDFPWFERAISSYLEIALWFTLMQIGLLYVFDLYERPRSKYYDYFDVLPRVVKAVSTGTLMLVFFAFFARQFFLPRSIVLFSWVFNIFLLAGWRWFALYREQKKRQPKRVLIYGTGMLAALVEEELRKRVALRYEPMGFIQSTKSVPTGLVAPVLGTLDDLETLIERQKIDEVIFAPEERSEEELIGVLGRCQSARVDTRVAPELFEIAMGAIHLDHLEVPLLEPSALPARYWYLRIKRVLDLFIAGLLLVLAAPVAAVIAFLVKLNSPGSVFFRQRRVGWGGKEFTLYKFRTMREPAEVSLGEDNESDLERMTSVGKFLRLTRLDELPQLYNVLKGEMSLVGPRAEWAKLAYQMEREIPFFEQRYLVRPGMTGWSQVEFKYTKSTTEYRKKVQYDLYYIKNMSLALDVRILLKTIWVVLTAKGAR
ncbi:exopolysaccharide biosynthesis polyprenyl glycosylphosphotransferase [Candidatus Acetothermia bacterium]|nr:exopolysaccharide biosynthesis polyprenyl glycosylphosphotransferase [Candidatus Acetothermia bacterium]